MSRILKVLLPVMLLVVPVAGLIGYQVYRSRTSYLVALGHQAVERGDYTEARRVAESLENKGRLDEAHLLRCEVFITAAETAAPLPGTLALDSSPEALALYRGALAEVAELPPEGPLADRANVLAARCLMHLRRQREAEDRVKTVLEHDPDNADAHRLLAGIYMDLNSPTEAVREFREWARLDPDNGLPYRWIGFFQKDYDATDEAVQAYQEALHRNLAPAMRSAVLKELAQTYCTGQKQYAAALDTLEQLPAALQQNLDMLLVRIESLFNQRREAEAARIADQALKEHPRNAALLRLRGQIYAGTDKPEQAVPLLEQAVRLDPYDLSAQTLLVEGYRQSKRTTDAARQVQALEAAQKTRMQLSNLIGTADGRPWDDEVRVQIAELCRKINEPEAARMWLRAALASNPGNAQAAQLLGRMPEGEGR